MNDQSGGSPFDSTSLRSARTETGETEQQAPPQDPIQQRLTRYALDLRYEDIPEQTIHAAKVRIIDTLGALMAGYTDEPSVIARSIAADVTSASGATIVGTKIRTTPELAAFANGTAARSAEMNDYDRKPGGRNGHPSDVVLPVYAAAEHVGASGRDFITAVVLAYEVYIRFAEQIGLTAFDATNFCCLGTAAAAGKLMGLTEAQMAHCLSLAAIPSNALNQTRAGQLSMWKAVATGHAGRAGVFAALMARKGMEGPYLPFTGKNGWLNYIAHKPLSLDSLVVGAEPFRIDDTTIKPRAACFHTQASIMAAERAAASLKNGVDDISHVMLEIYGAKERAVDKVPPGAGGGGHHWWHPHTRESADHSTPYAVAATLMDGTVTQASFDDAHLWDPTLRALLGKIEVHENPEFTAAYERRPVQHCSRVTVTTAGGERIVGEYGGRHGNLGDAWDRDRVDEKFTGLCTAALGATRVRALLDRLWNLEEMRDVASLAPELAFE